MKDQEAYFLKVDLLRLLLASSRLVKSYDGDHVSEEKLQRLKDTVESILSESKMREAK